MVLAYKFHGHFENLSHFSWFKKVVKQSFASRAAGEFFFIPLICVQTFKIHGHFRHFFKNSWSTLKIHGFHGFFMVQKKFMVISWFSWFSWSGGNPAYSSSEGNLNCTGPHSDKFQLVYLITSLFIAQEKNESKKL